MLADYNTFFGDRFSGWREALPVQLALANEYSQTHFNFDSKLNIPTYMLATRNPEFTLHEMAPKEAVGFILFPESFPAPRLEADKLVVEQVKERLGAFPKMSVEAAMHRIISLLTKRSKDIKSDVVIDSEHYYYADLHTSPLLSVTEVTPIIKDNIELALIEKAAKHLYSMCTLIEPNRRRGVLERLILNSEMCGVPLSSRLTAYIGP